VPVLPPTDSLPPQQACGNHERNTNSKEDQSLCKVQSSDHQSAPTAIAVIAFRFADCGGVYVPIVATSSR
jgi:hypothetical protein